MSKLTEKQIEFAKHLLKQHPAETQVFVKTENGHMYFKKEAALMSVGNDEKKLETVTADTVASETSKETKALTEMKFTELKAYAEQKGIALDPADNSREKALAKIQAAESPAQK
jgi:hypothetical protein